MTRKEIEEELIRGVSPILARDGAPAISPDASLVELGIDSLGLIEMFVFIEKKFNLRLLESGMGREDMETLGSLASYISSRV